MDSILSLLVGPLGKSFRIFKEYGILPKDMNFIEFSEEMYDKYYMSVGMPSGRLFLLIPLNFTGKDPDEIDHMISQYIWENRKELPTVTEVEKREMLKAVEFVLKTTDNLPSNASDMERISKFMNLFPMFEQYEYNKSGFEIKEFSSRETKVMLLEVAGAIREICIDKSFRSPLETLAFVRDLMCGE